MSLSQWLTVVGIGEDGLSGLGDVAKQAIGEAETVFGGRRHLGLVEGLGSAERRAWPTPFDPAMTDVLEARGRRVCVLASGDPFLHGVGATLARVIDPTEMHVIPAPSAFSLAAARLGWPLAEVETISLHGKAVELIRPLLHPGRRILALTSDADAPHTIANYLTRHGFGLSRLTVLESLGARAERIRHVQSDTFDIDSINPLNVLSIEVNASHEAQILTLAAGLPDHVFEHDGQITKRGIRAVTLSALAPRRGELLWDIGAGSGSVAIEWMLADLSLRAVAIEQNAARAARIRRNALACGTPGLRLVEGSAPAALAGLPSPDAIFVGGGGSDTGVLDAAIGALKAGGRLVANAVTLEMEALLLARYGERGGELTRIAISHAAPIGGMTGWRPAMPVTQWSWVKP